MTHRQISIAFQTDKPLAAYGPLAAAVEQHGFDGITVYNDLLYQPAWLPLLEIARATRAGQNWAWPQLTRSPVTPSILPATSH
ncbi:MAG: hypothetical protein R2867_33510 [Caldilineaceae bacterium]